MIYIGYDTDELAEKERKYDEAKELIKEEWRQIILDDEVYEYEVSNKGEIRSMKTGKVLHSVINKNDYCRVTLSKNGIHKKVMIHRTMALMFLPLPKKYAKKCLTFKNLVPNHIDGVKHHNIISNLEWVTHKENVQHAIDTGLMKIGEDHNYATITNAQAKMICELLQDGLSNKDISRITFIPENTIHDIKSRKGWKHISKNYVFPKLVDTTPYSMSDEDLHKLCKDLVKGEKTGKALAKKYGVSKAYVAMVRHHKVRPEIVDLYDFTKAKNLPKRQNDELIHNICKEMQNKKMKLQDIAKKYGVSPSFMSELKNGTIRPDITSFYQL